MYIQIITSTLEDTIIACDKARAIIDGIHLPGKRLQVRVGISDAYDNLMQVRCPDITIVGAGHYTGTVQGEHFRISHAACNAWYEEEIVVLEGPTELDHELRESFWNAIETLRSDGQDIAPSELA